MKNGAALRLMLPGNVWLARKLVEMQTGLGLFNSCLLAREATRLEVLHVFWCYLSSKLVLWTYPWRPGIWCRQHGAWQDRAAAAAPRYDCPTVAPTTHEATAPPQHVFQPLRRRRRDHVQGNT